MTHPSRRLLAAIVLASALASRASAQDDVAVRHARALTKQADQDRKAGRTAAVLDALIAARALRPDHPGVVLELAAAYAASGRPDDGLAALRQVAAMGVALPAADRTEFAAYRTAPGFAEAFAALERNAAPRATSTVALTVHEQGLVPEGLAFDPATGDFFVSSVHERRILRVDKDGKATPFADRASGLFCAMGMRVDPARRKLWVATSAMNVMDGFGPADEGRAALVRFDLASGRADRRLDAPAGAPHVFGDLTLGPDGTVYTTDSVTPAVYRAGPDGGPLEPLAAGMPLVSPQGVAVTPDGARLVVSDYAKGIFTLDLASRRLRALEGPAGTTLLGIDGIYLQDGALWAVQNGVEPNRLVRLALDEGAVRSLEVVDAAHPAYADPTLGVVAAGRFCYIASSQWSAMGDDGKRNPSVPLKDVAVLCTPLPPAH